MSVYSFQFYYKEELDKFYPFQNIIKGLDGKVDFQLGANPKVSIHPIQIDGKIFKKYNFQIAYHLLMSTKKSDVDFLSGCDQLFYNLIDEQSKGEVVEEVIRGALPENDALFSLISAMNISPSKPKENLRVSIMANSRVLSAKKAKSKKLRFKKPKPENFIAQKTQNWKET